MRAAACHPERRLHAKRMCASCYNRQWRNLPGPVTRPAGKFRWPPDDPYELIPGRVPGVRQNAVTERPGRCPKCGNIFLEQRGREFHCAGHLTGCGLTLYLVAPFEMTLVGRPMARTGAAHETARVAV